MPAPPPGRRERKKAATRQSIADAALRLFLDRGYDQVSIKEVAEAADVSTATVFKHFTGKEALVFDQDENRESALVVAVQERPPNKTIIQALQDHVQQSWLPIAEHPKMPEFTALINSTPALSAYSERMWTRHTEALSRAIANDTGAPENDPSCQALARFVLEIPALTQNQEDKEAAVKTIFNILTNGWQPPKPTTPS